MMDKNFQYQGLLSFFDLIKSREAHSQTLFANQLADAVEDLGLGHRECQHITDRFKTGDNLAEAFFQSGKETMTVFLQDYLHEASHG